MQRFEDSVRRCPQHNKPTVEDLSGRTIADRYELKRLLGVGGMNSTVWVAWHHATHRNVALKLLPATHPAAAERFARGARLASNLSHPNITVVHDYGQTPENQLFLVMELLEGASMHDALKAHGAMPPDRALRIGEQVLRALEHAHRKHIVHRDLKPGNLFLGGGHHGDDQDFVKVLDFGIAKAFEYGDGDDGDGDGDGGLGGLSSEVTHQRQVCGTPHYMAPEQISMGRVDARTDLYSLGVVMYRMLTARLPFEGKETHDLFRMHLTEPPQLFRVSRPDLDIPAPIEAVVMRSLAKEPDDRFASAGEMRAALREVRRGLGLFSDEDSINSSASLPPSISGVRPVQPRPAAAPSPASTQTAAQRAPTLDVMPPSKQHHRRTLLVGGLGAAVALFGVGLVWALRANPDAPSGAPAPGSATVISTFISAAPSSAAATANAPAPANDDITVLVESTPSEATVRTATRPLGLTPLRIALPRDTAALYLDKAGFRSQEVPLALASAPHGAVEPLKYTVTLEALPGAPAAHASLPAPGGHGGTTHAAQPASAAAAPAGHPGVQLLDDDGTTPAATPAQPAGGDPGSVDLIDVSRPSSKPAAKPSAGTKVDLIE